MINLERYEDAARRLDRLTQAECCVIDAELRITTQLMHIEKLAADSFDTTLAKKLLEVMMQRLILLYHYLQMVRAETAY